MYFLQQQGSEAFSHNSFLKSTSCGYVYVAWLISTKITILLAEYSCIPSCQSQVWPRFECIVWKNWFRFEWIVWKNWSFLCSWLELICGKIFLFFRTILYSNPPVVGMWHDWFIYTPIPSPAYGLFTLLMIYYTLGICSLTWSQNFK